MCPTSGSRQPAFLHLQPQRRAGSVFGSITFLIITPAGPLKMEDKQAQDCTQEQWWSVRRMRNASHSTAQNSC